MTIKDVRLSIAVVCLLLVPQFVLAQNFDPHGPLTLRSYYSDLYLALEQYDIDDVPFKNRRVKVQRDDTLLKIAVRHRVAGLDSVHLAAALYDANASKFGNGRNVQLQAGDTLKMPSVGDIFYAQDRYERLRLVGETLDFSNEVNQMRIGLREPYANEYLNDTLLASAEDESVGEFVLPEASSVADDIAAPTLPVTADSSESHLTETSQIARASIAVSATDAEPVLGAGLGHAIHVTESAYLGQPRNAKVSPSNDAITDPLRAIVEWEYEAGATVGAVLSKLADYVGYELNSTDNSVLDAYSRRLPALQRNISGITAEDGFLMLAGRGLKTTFDHVSRSVTHTPAGSAPSLAMERTFVNSRVHEKLVQATGISSMLKQLPGDIISAAQRHASRCESSVSTQQPDAVRLQQLVNHRLQQDTPEAVVDNLLAWYESPTGNEVLKLQRKVIEEAEFQRFSLDEQRADRIRQIYDYTVTGAGIASIAVHMDYAGWSLSGCRHAAEGSGDVNKMNSEMVLGQGIKRKLPKLESLLREEMLQTLAYQFASLSDSELTEYADIVITHAGVYSELEQSILEAIEQETQRLTKTSLQ